MKILINGAGVAGPTLAWWLARADHEVTLVERAPALRSGGYVIDFWGAGYDIAERMKILPRILEQGYQVQEVRFVDRTGRKVGGFGTKIFTRATNGRFTSIRRSDLAATIFAELVYVTYAVPGRQLSRFAMRDDRTLFLAVFRDEYCGMPDCASGVADPKDIVRRIYSGLGWECAGIVAAMDDAEEIYFDRVSQIRMRRWTSGRVALVGDAAACVSLLAGEGTGLAMAEAYVLAAELAAAKGDYRAAFAAYERRMMPFLEKKQRSAARFASSFVPESAVGIGCRNLVTKLLRFGPFAYWFIERDLRDDLALPC